MLIVIETTDIVFAVDSVPAVLAITRDPFIVYTSNIFAILGLRSLYFALAGVIQKFALPELRSGGHPGLPGIKMIISSEFFNIHVPVLCISGGGGGYTGDFGDCLADYDPARIQTRYSEGRSEKWKKRKYQKKDGARN